MRGGGVSLTTTSLFQTRINCQPLFNDFTTFYSLLKTRKSEVIEPGDKQRVFKPQVGVLVLNRDQRTPNSSLSLASSPKTRVRRVGKEKNTS